MSDEIPKFLTFYNEQYHSYIVALFAPAVFNRVVNPFKNLFI